jgi:Ribonuclease G/E
VLVAVRYAGQDGTEEEIVRQVGNLPELYEGARSKKI